MSDGSPDDTTGANDGERDDDGESDAAAGIDAPGGGPNRVVSDRSVDDVLDALHDGPAADAGAETGADPAEVDETVEDGQATDEGDVETADEDVAATDDGTNAADETADDAEVDGGDASEVESDETADDETAGPVDATGPEERQSDPGLAARVETGDVTGADVRAAEAGEGREATPAVGEIDLSLDDLDAGADGAATDPTRRTDDGPSGLLGRLRALFSR